MITFECSWCDGDLVIERLDAPSVECAECRIVVEIASDPEELALAA